MEPNTGVTFADVAGVDEAKQDFMEVRGAQGRRLPRWWLGTVAVGAAGLLASC